MPVWCLFEMTSNKENTSQRQGSSKHTVETALSYLFGEAAGVSRPFDLTGCGRGINVRLRPEVIK